MGSVLVEYVVGSLARAKLADVDFGRCTGLPLGGVTSSERLRLNLRIESSG